MNEPLQLACCELLLELYRGARALNTAEFPGFAFGLIAAALRLDASRWTALKLVDPIALLAPRDRRLLQALLPHVVEAQRINASLGAPARQADARARASPASASPGGRLTARELRVAALYGAGRSHKEIARELELSPVTVRNHLQHVYSKLRVNDKAQLARVMAREGLL